MKRNRSQAGVGQPWANRRSAWKRLGWIRCLRVCGLMALFAAPLPAARIEVDGTGWLRDRELRRALNRLLEAPNRPSLDANALEDAAVILVSTVAEAGFQKPELEIEALLADGTKEKFNFDPTFARPLPRPMEAKAVTFRVQRGVRSHIDAVEVLGLTAIPIKRARGFFRNDGTLVASDRTNAYAPSRVTRGADGLLAELRQRGYADAQVRTAVTREVKGSITLQVDVKEGARWDVVEVKLDFDEAAPPTLPRPKDWIGKPWSPTFEQDLREAVRQAYFREGHPDVGVHIEAEAQPAPADAARKEIAVVVTIVPGERVVVGAVRFEGNKVTREGVLRRRVELAPGEPLNPIMLEKARYRISRLGVFEVVDLRYEPADGATRDPVFTLREGPRYETNLIFGYGSYEQVRGGVEYRQKNIMGRAHQSRLELIQSLKSTSGDYTYTVPELFGESLDGTGKLFGLQRQEIAFLRQEFGVSVTLRRPVRRLGGEATAGYTFQALRNRRNALSTQATDEKQVNVASLNVGLSGDRRDSPLRPRHGYHWTTQIEAADPKLGGQTTYQRFEFGGAYHTGWGGGRWVHIGLTHGVITTIGSNDATLPVNKRFYPGGDNSIRGYQRGEAAPRGADGRFVGAKAQLLGNLEFEQALTPSWSVVAFGDALGSAVSLRDYPFSERLYSVGLGLRYQTLIGPIRVEYGRNINPRPADPRGTWQFSLGYPF